MGLASATVRSDELKDLCALFDITMDNVVRANLFRKNIFIRSVEKICAMSGHCNALVYMSTRTDCDTLCEKMKCFEDMTIENLGLALKQKSSSDVRTNMKIHANFMKFAQSVQKFSGRGLAIERWFKSVEQAAPTVMPGVLVGTNPMFADAVKKPAG